MKFSIHILIYLYRISPLGYLSRKMKCCRFHPSCSQYMLDAVDKYGFKGIMMGLWRIVRCNPFNHGDRYDPVK